MLQVSFTGQFKKDYKLCKKRGYNMELEVRLLERAGCPLKAPVTGNMKRTIREGAACRALYRFLINGNSVFCFETDKASFEYEYP